MCTPELQAQGGNKHGLSKEGGAKSNILPPFSEVLEYILNLIPLKQKKIKPSHIDQFMNFIPVLLYW
jgi:hypothetical protein